MNKYLQQYIDFAQKYSEAQTDFYKKYPDLSRENFYKLIGLPVKGKRILDAGCGFGKDVMYLSELGAEVYGFDGVSEMIELAIEQYPKLTNLSVQQFEELNYHDEYFDAVISRYALHYADDLLKSFKEFYRVLKPSGMAIILVAHPLLAFVAKKDREYHSQDEVEIPLFDDTIIIKEPSRTFGDYLSVHVLEMFDLIEFFESPGLENAPQENSFSEVVPDYMIMKFRKREKTSE